MSGTKEELTRNWLVKAKRDLLSARELAEADIPLLDTHWDREWRDTSEGSPAKQYRRLTLRAQFANILIVSE